MISVVIPYFGAESTIGAQLDALARQERGPDPWEVVISDNESSDHLRRIVRLFEDRIPEVDVADASDRRGRAHARNVGVEAAKHDAIAFCDADDEVGEGWLIAMSARWLVTTSSHAGRISRS